MSDAALLDEFIAFAAAPRGPVEGAFLVGRAIDPGFDVDWCRTELARLAAGAGRNALELVAHLRAQGFAGAKDYYRVGNSSLMEVLRSKRGIPISLAMVVAGVAEQCGMVAVGINFPSHFLVAVEGVLIDPFTMQPADRRECEAWLEARGMAVEGAFKSASAPEVLLRMLNNLRLLALGQGDHSRALELSDYQLAVAAERLPLHLERVESWLALGVTGMARHELESALALADNVALRQQIAARIAALETKPSSLN